MFKRLREALSASGEVPKLERQLALSQAYALKMQEKFDLLRSAISKKDKRIDKFFQRHPELRNEFFDIDPSPQRKAKKENGQPTP